MRPNYWIRGGCIAAAFLMAAVVLCGAHEIGKVNHVPHALHKVEHFLYYGIMAFLLAYGAGRRFLWAAFAAVLLVGVLDEWHQFYVPGRNSSAYDWLTDAVGAFVAVYVYRRWIGAEGKGER